MNDEPHNDDVEQQGPLDELGVRDLIDRDSERLLIGALLRNKQVERITTILAADDFGDEACASAFAICLELLQAGPIELPTFRERWYVPDRVAEPHCDVEEFLRGPLGKANEALKSTKIRKVLRVLDEVKEMLDDAIYTSDDDFEESFYKANTVLASLRVWLDVWHQARIVLEDRR